MDDTTHSSSFNQPEIASLARYLCRRNPVVRAAARVKLEAAGPDALDAAIRALDSRFTRINRTERVTRAVCFLPQIPYWLFRLLSLHYKHSHYPWLVVVFFIATLFALGYLLTVRLFAMQVSGRAIREIAQIEDRAVIPALIEALGFAGPRLRTVIRKALIEKLPSLTNSDRPRISSGKQELLVRELEKSAGDYYSNEYSVELSLGILSALTAIGDENAIPAVSRVENSPFFDSRRSVVRRAAKECLSVLRERQVHEAASSVLLRATEHHEQFLLQPASGSGDIIREETLLRPAGGGSGAAGITSLVRPAGL